MTALGKVFCTSLSPRLIVEEEKLWVAPGFSHSFSVEAGTAPLRVDLGLLEAVTQLELKASVPFRTSKRKKSRKAK